MRFSSMLIRSLLLVMLICSAELTVNAQYDIEYLDSWPASGEMKFIRVRITPVKGVAKRDLNFHVVSNSASYQSLGVTASTIIPLRKGDASATGELYAFNYGYNFSIHTELDGNHKFDSRDDFAYKTYSGNLQSQINSGIGSMTPSMLFASSAVSANNSSKYTALSRSVPKDMAVYTPLAIEDEFLDLGCLEDWYGANSSIYNGTRSPMKIRGLSSDFISALSLDSLPSKWFAYEGLGAVVITMEDLKLLSTKHPDKLLAVERWVAASGCLIVLNCGSKLEKSEQVLKLLGDSNSNVRDNRKCVFKYKPVDKEKIDSARKALGNRFSPMNYQQQAQAAVAIDDIDDRYPRKSDTFKNVIGSQREDDYVSIEFERGRVIVVTDEASDWSTEAGKDSNLWINFASFLRATGSDTGEFHGVLRNGTIRNIGFPEFDQPPRYVFEFSIMAYLLAVGPVTFFLLKRKHKLNLMFVVVPFISVLFCSSILGYAIFSEGFETRVNMFTVTSLDQRSGRQTTSSIAHVYSGITPSSYRLTGPTYGLVNLSLAGRELRTNWSDAGQEITGGEIRARTNHQLSARTSNETENRLVFSFDASGDSASVRNQLGVPVGAVAFLSEDCAKEEAWFCENIGAEQIAEAKKMSISEIAAKVRDIVHARGRETVFYLSLIHI